MNVLLPCISIFDMTNHRLTNSVSTRKDGLLFNREAYINRLLSGYLRSFGCVMMILSTGKLATPIPSLFDKVLHIVLLGSKEQMRWINTFWIVAMMQYSKIIGYLSYGNNPRKAMSKDVFTGTRGTTVEISVPFWIQVCGPFPTILGLVNLAPKPRYDFTIEH